MNRTQIQNLKIGDFIEETYDCSRDKVLPNARWSAPREVVEIFARGESIKGKAYVCGYTYFGENSRISFSADETEERFRLVSEIATDEIVAQYNAFMAYANDFVKKPGADADIVKYNWEKLFAFEKALRQRNALQPAFYSED